MFNPAFFSNRSAFDPAAAGSSSVIKMIQQGTVTVASGAPSGTYTISPAITNTANVMLLWNGQTTTDNGGLVSRSACLLTLTNSTTVTATRVATGAFANTIAFTIVEFASGVNSIQSGTITIASGSGNSNTANPAIPVGSNAFVLYQGCNISGSDTATIPQGGVTLNTGTNTVTFFGETSASLNQTIGYTVVDLDTTVVTSAQHIVSNLSTTNTTDNATLGTAVTAANSSIIFGGQAQTGGTTGSVYSNFLTNGTTVAQTRTGVGAGTRSVYYAVVNWASSALNGSVQRTNSALNISASTSATWTLGTSVTQSKSFVNYTGYNAVNATLVNTVMPSVALTSGTTVVSSVNTSGTTQPMAEVVQFL